jgi:hypothetical protein
VDERLAVFGGEGDVGEVGATVPGVYGIRTVACCADPTGDCELVKVAFDLDAHHVLPGCVDPARDVQGADLAAWLDAEGDGLELHLDSLDQAQRLATLGGQIPGDVQDRQMLADLDADRAVAVGRDRLE